MNVAKKDEIRIGVRNALSADDEWPWENVEDGKLVIFSDFTTYHEKKLKDWYIEYSFVQSDDDFWVYLWHEKDIIMCFPYYIAKEVMVDSFTELIYRYVHGRKPPAYPPHTEYEIIEKRRKRT